MSITDKNIVYEDYKFVLQDTLNNVVSFGAKFTYEELLEREDVPFKFKAVCKKYLFEDIDHETSLESLIYHLEPNGFGYECLKQLKCRVKYAKPVTRKSLFGKTKTEFKQFSDKIEDFSSMSVAQKEEAQIIIQEISISKLALSIFSA